MKNNNFRQKQISSSGARTEMRSGPSKRQWEKTQDCAKLEKLTIKSSLKVCDYLPIVFQHACEICPNIVRKKKKKNYRTITFHHTDGANYTERKTNTLFGLRGGRGRESKLNYLVWIFF